MAIDIKLPSLGEGIENGDVIKLLVNVGDVVAKEQGLLELGTDKASVEVPSSHAGRIVKIHIAEGQTIPIGAVLVTLESAQAAAQTAADGKPGASAPPQPNETKATSTKATTSEDSGEKSPPGEAPGEEPAKQTSPTKPQAAKSAAAKSDAAKSDDEGPSTADDDSTPPSADGPGEALIAASPSVRRFAREVGVDMRRLQGTGPGGRITRDDVLGVVRQASHAAQKGGGSRKSVAVSKEQDDFGPVRTEKATRFRQTIAQRMHQSWSSVPRVTNFDDADVTELERVRTSSKEDYAKRGIRLTALPFVIKAVAMALKDHPAVNATMSADNTQIIYKEYVSIGVAVDTERGLVVPALGHADEKSIPEIARALGEITDKARSKGFSLEELRGSTFSISNLGAIGGTYSTPIVNAPEVAILLLGRSRKMPVVVDDQIAIRLMMPLSLSYDHRLVDGATAARFLNDVIDYLEAPGRLLLAP